MHTSNIHVANMSANMSAARDAQVCTVDDIATQNASGGEKIHMAPATEIALEVMQAAPRVPLEYRSTMEGTKAAQHGTPRD